MLFAAGFKPSPHHPFQGWSQHRVPRDCSLGSVAAWALWRPPKTLDVARIIRGKTTLSICFTDLYLMNNSAYIDAKIGRGEFALKTTALILIYLDCKDELPRRIDELAKSAPRTNQTRNLFPPSGEI